MSSRRDAMGPRAFALALALVATAVVGARAIAPATRVDGLRRASVARALGGARGDFEINDDVEDAERWFDQTLDHFDHVDRRRWSQRYFVNEGFVDKIEASTPVFVCVGGEGPALTARAVLDGGTHCGTMIDLAKKHRGIALALEHRFYGASQPTGDLSRESLRYLTSAQALEDVVAFVKYVADAYGLRTTPSDDGRNGSYSRVIAFGGSYPGMLAAWSRVKYPHAIHAAVASSAPIRAELDMRGYYDVVGKALREKDVGGSDACFDAVSETFESELNEALKTPEGRRALETRFNVCGDAALDQFGGRDGFADVLRAMFPAQNNDPSCEMEDTSCLNIAKACTMMTRAETGKRLDALASVVKVVFGSSCVSLDGAAYMRELMSETPNPLGEGERQWTWQTCTEFAFFQTCEKDSGCPFKLDPPTMPLSSYQWICAQVFGVSAEQTKNAVERSNARYGGITPGGTRILFPSGSVDPWIANSFVSNTFSPKWEPAFVVPGASHHAWTHPPKDTDSAAVVQARARIEKQVEKWMNQGPMTLDSARDRLRVGRV
ncbi:Twin-arginine translocation pathway, signal sequence [Ostreococcus tauri]|uniref:Twin-arginine translocation pathway, signal sequence n=1 Tax=Ostreococcus tauri TaxID=70448 RepID=A0A090N456_OSTTA|nr:Twin-arginine translocation pathway, signal sequence [Ostreococcus tauri]CEF99283.1 Twin-arginine translocation pathway, signal sequence [Ostreococcus tauri]|eukprot:XP_003081490.2 Twin-arginine translocation pathway, signal sequence [Ostreococcus tauri]